jgi:hypothetical protein
LFIDNDTNPVVQLSQSFSFTLLLLAVASVKGKEAHLQTRNRKKASQKIRIRTIRWTLWPVQTFHCVVLIRILSKSENIIGMEKILKQRRWVKNRIEWNIPVLNEKVPLRTGQSKNQKHH